MFTNHYQTSACIGYVRTDEICKNKFEKYKHSVTTIYSRAN